MPVLYRCFFLLWICTYKKVGLYEFLMLATAVAMAVLFRWKLRAKCMGSANCVATGLLTGRLCEPQRALRTSTKGIGVHETATEDCTEGSAKDEPPTDPHGVHEGLRESQAPARSHANSTLLATQSSDLFSLGGTDDSEIVRPWPLHS